MQGLGWQGGGRCVRGWVTQMKKLPTRIRPCSRKVGGWIAPGRGACKHAVECSEGYSETLHQEKLRRRAGRLVLSQQGGAKRALPGKAAGTRARWLTRQVDGGRQQLSGAEG